MIKGFRFKALTRKGEAEIRRELAEIDLNRKVALFEKPVKMRVKMKRVIESPVVVENPLIVEIFFKNKIVEGIKRAGFVEDSPAVVKAKHEFVKDLICVEGEDYFFEVIKDE